ncbi:HEAT repeat domain-containing protein [Cohnella yongneupensis]|uniref:HEAT repeat domain-containing protein n=1 Tax=Cohnella yongneupensis TaxID=425006 RepID=A0ABW0R711_9BACL
MAIDGSLLLIVSAGLLFSFFLAIVCTWLYSYIRMRSVRTINRELEGILALVLRKEEGRLGIPKLRRYVKNSFVKQELLMQMLIRLGDEYLVDHQDRMASVIEQSGIQTLLIKLLSTKNPHKQSLACRFAGDLRVHGVQTYIYPLMQSSNNDVVYNALLALAKMADLQGLSESLRANSGQFGLSFRAIVEIVRAFRGSLEELVRETIEYSDDYIKGILIKAAADNKCQGLIDYYIRYLSSNNKNLRIACIRAISELEDTANESYVADMLEDAEWEVRAAAAKSLEKIGTENSCASLGKAVQDKEWWVRQNAASALITIPGGIEIANRIIDGDDKFARDALLGVMSVSP